MFILATCSQIFCDLKKIFDNRCFRNKENSEKENDYRYIEILILVPKIGSTLNEFDVCVIVNSLDSP